MLPTLFCWFQELIDIKMAQCHRVVNGELVGARGKRLCTQTLRRHFPPDIELLILKCSQEVI